MPQYLIMKLDGPMQAWGRHSFEDFRPSHPFPTRSGLLGLIAACMGIERSNMKAQRDLAESLVITVRADKQVVRLEQEKQQYPRRAVNMVDYHTVLEARKVDGKRNPHPVVSRREYLYDATFTVAIKVRDGAIISLKKIEEAIKNPVYTPVLGRRSCPMTRPLYAGYAEKTSAYDALMSLETDTGTIYTEENESERGKAMSIRDVPMHQHHRKFKNRVIYMINESGDA